MWTRTGEFFFPSFSNSLQVVFVVLFILLLLVEFIFYFYRCSSSQFVGFLVNPNPSHLQFYIYMSVLLYQCLPGQQLVCSSGKEWPQLTNPVKTWSRALHPTSPLWRRAYQPTRRLPWRTPLKRLEGLMEEFDKLKCEGSHIIEANENMATFLTLKYCFSFSLF